MAEPDKHCSAKADCVGLFHQIDACGTLLAVAVNRESRESFDYAERGCRQRFPLTRCAPQPMRAEDGQSSPDQGRIVTECLEGRCTTVVR